MKKFKLGLVLAFLTFFGIFNSFIFGPVDVVAQNKLTVATVNGGDEAFVAQQMYQEHKVKYIYGVEAICFLALVIGLYGRGIQKLINHNSNIPW